MAYKIEGSIIDMTGDGVWPEMSKLIREELIAKFFDIDWKVHDISLQARDRTNDKSLDDAIADLVEHKSTVKGPTITPTPKQTEIMGLSKQWGSPNGKIRSAIKGAVIMRTPIEPNNIPKNSPKISGVTTARQAVGGIYGAPNFDVPSKGTIKIVFEGEDGTVQTLAQKQTDKGVALLTTETDDAIRDFAYATLGQGLAMNKSVLFCAKSSIKPVYDTRFGDIFEEVFNEHFAQDYKDAGIELMLKDPDGDAYLIDGVVSKIPQGKLNNMIIAFQNYDGDVGSDQIAGENSSLGMMDSTLVSASGILLADPPHGTAPDLDKFWHEEGKLVANPTAHIFAYAEAIRHKAELNGQQEGVKLAVALKDAVIKTIEAGHMTGDLSYLIEDEDIQALTAQEFVAKVNETMNATLNLDMDKSNGLSHLDI